MKKKKPLSHYLDLMKSAQDKQKWIKVRRYGEIALKKLPNLSYSPFDKYLLYCRLGFSYFELSKYSVSLDMYYTAHLIASKYHLAPERVVYANLHLGRNLQGMYRITQAISQYLKVEEYYQKYGTDKFPMSKEVYFSTIVNLGWCYLYNEELEKTKEIIYERLPPYQNTLNNFGEYYTLKGAYLAVRKEYPQARQSFNEFIKISLERNNFHLIRRTKFSLATLDLFEGQLESAIRILECLLKEARHLKLNEFICSTVLLLSKCYLLKNMPAKSASVEKMIAPLLKSLDITWFYEMTRQMERFYRQLQPRYQNLASPLIPEIITNKIEEHYQSSSYAKVIIGKSNLMWEVLQLVEKIAPTDLPVLIQGETGTGKELIARAIHNNSLRKEKSLVAINCGTLSETLLENELFGHVKGAFTDAKSDKRGYIEFASDGTLFLDEIADMSSNMQQKLLRILEEKLVWRLGTEKPVPVNPRFIFASNQNIEELVKRKLFREDLHYRINTIVIILPPLRERKEDIPLLVKHFLKKCSYPSFTLTGEEKSDGIEISPMALSCLMNYSWPGNVRELENEIKRIYALYPTLRSPVQRADTNIIEETMLSEIIRNYSSKNLQGFNQKSSLKGLKDTYEKSIIIETLKKYNGNITQTARELGCLQPHLSRKIKQLKISPSTYVTKR